MDAEVVVNPGAGGAAVKTLEVTGFIPVAGVMTPVTFEIQNVALTDKTGETISMRGVEEKLDRVIELLEVLARAEGFFGA